MTTPKIEEDLDRVIKGGVAIAAEFDPPLTQAQVFYHLEKGNIPASKLGRCWITTRRRIRQAALVERTIAQVAV